MTSDESGWLGINFPKVCSVFEFFHTELIQPWLCSPGKLEQKVPGAQMLKPEAGGGLVSE